jgi:hypothetical protein
MRYGFVTIATFGLLCFTAGCGPNAEVERLVAEGKRRQLEHEEKIADMKAEDEKRKAESKAAEEEWQRQNLEGEISLRLAKTGFAYFEAKQKLGRSPKGTEDLKPHLEREEDSKSPRDGQPFEIAWGTEVGLQGSPLIWEKSADADGGRWVFPPLGSVIVVGRPPSLRAVRIGGVVVNPVVGGSTARYVSEREFQTLRSAPPVGPGIQPPLQLPPQLPPKTPPPDVIVPPDARKGPATEAGKQAPPPPPVMIILPGAKNGPAGAIDPGKQTPLPK